MKLISALLACLLTCSGVARASSDICNGTASDPADCITPATPTYSPEPTYPENERKARHEGQVVLKVLIDTEGVPHDISVARSLSPDFDAAAIAAVQTWRFTPAMKYGKPIPLRMGIQVAFHLRK
jgi:TonB family protein